MMSSWFSKLFAVLSGIALARAMDLAPLLPFVASGYAAVLLLVFALTRARVAVCQTWLPPALKVSHALFLLLALCGWGQEGDPAWLVPLVVLMLCLVKTTNSVVEQALAAQRLASTDPSAKDSGDELLEGVLRTAGIARLTGLGGACWLLASGVKLYLDKPVAGIGCAAVLTLGALVLVEALRALLLLEQKCPRCQSLKFSPFNLSLRLSGLGLALAGFAGLSEQPVSLLAAGASLQVLAVLTAGSGLDPSHKLLLGVRQSMLKNCGLQPQSDLDQKEEEQARRVKLPQAAVPPVTELMKVDPVSVEVGRALLELVDPHRDAKLLERVTSVRRHLALELGFVLPGVRFRDNLRLEPYSYTLRLRENEMGQGRVVPQRYLAIGSEVKLKHLGQELTQDPTYGMPGIWIDPAQRSQAEELGCMIFDPVSVLATHLTEMVRQNASSFVGLSETRALLANVDDTLLVEHVLKRVSLVELRDLLRALLAEKVSIRDLPWILETLADRKPEEDGAAMLAKVRVSLARTICKEYKNEENIIPCIGFDDQLEALVEADWEAVAERVTPLLEEAAADLLERGLRPVVVTPPRLRARVRRALPSLVVLSTDEIPPQVQVRVVHSVTWQPER